VPLHEFGRNAYTPGLYVHFATSKILFGDKIWMPDSEHLLKTRNSIVDKSKCRGRKLATTRSEGGS